MCHISFQMNWGLSSDRSVLDVVSNSSLFGSL